MEKLVFHENEVLSTTCITISAGDILSPSTGRKIRFGLILRAILAQYRFEGA